MPRNALDGGHMALVRLSGFNEAAAVMPRNAAREAVLRELERRASMRPRQ